jgi:acetylornithine deacetylase
MPRAAGDVDVVALTRALVDIDSTTGQEAACGRWLAGFLRERGFAVRELPVDAARFNVFARPAPEMGSDTGPTPTMPATTPDVVFSTHFDCVPPFFSSRIEGDRIVGRGACDAKGILAAQVTAVDRLARAGESRVGLLFVVGEERGSDGAKTANPLANGTRFLINGEPTESRVARATRGALRLRLRAAGRAAHSSFPELGESAIDKLLDALVELRSIPLPEDPVLGLTHYTIGVISGGVAPNVVSPSAAAELMFRTVSDAALVRRAVAPLERLVEIDDVLEVPLSKLHVVPGFDTAIFPFTTDIPFLDRWGTPLLFGPGSVHVAHTAGEFIDIAELRAAVDAYASIAQRLLSQ